MSWRGGFVTGALCLLGWVWAAPAGAQPDLPHLTQQQPGANRGLRKIRDRYEGERQDISLRLSARRVELANLLARDDVAKDTVKAKLSEIMSLEQQRQGLLIDEFYEAKSVMRPQQWQLYRRRVLRRLLNDRRGQQSPTPGSGPSSP